MLSAYIAAAMARAHYEIIENGDEPYYGSIPGLDGVWAVGATLEQAREELQEVLEDWILVRVRLGLDVPRLGDIDLNVQPVA
jgi:predicted RNase H-like HicB family nuclease